MSPPDLAYAIGLPPKAAIEYFEGKGLKVTGDWRELWQEQHARAFTVARLAKIDILNDLYDGLEGALKEGRTQRDFVRELTPILQRKGWWGKAIDKQTGEVLETYDDISGRPVEWGSPRRLKLIYRQNMQTAYMAGRYKQQQELAQADGPGARPYWQYLSVRDSRVRPAHAALHGRVWRADDPIWDRLYPPNGWGCRCRVRALSERRLQAEGLTVETARLEAVEVPAGKKPAGSPDLRPVTGVIYQDATGRDKLMRPDAGWSYNPGEAWLSQLTDLALAKAASLSAPAGLAAATELLGHARLRAAVATAYRDLAASVFQSMDAGQYQAQGTLLHVGVLSEVAIMQLASRDIEPESAVLSIRDRDLIHMERSEKAAPIPRDWLLSLPEHLRAPGAVLLDTTHARPSVLLVFDHQGDARTKIVVQLDYKVKVRNEDGKREVIKANIINTGRIVQAADLMSYEVLDGTL